MGRHMPRGGRGSLPQAPPRLESGGGDDHQEGILQLIAENQANVSAAFTIWAQEWEKQSEYESYIPQVRHEVLSVTEAQMSDKVVPGLGEYVFCRQRGCRSVFRNIGWIHNLAAGGGHCLCPACGQHYRPWMDKQGYHKASDGPPDGLQCEP